MSFSLLSILKDEGTVYLLLECGLRTASYSEQVLRNGVHVLMCILWVLSPYFVFSPWMMLSLIQQPHKEAH